MFGEIANNDRLRAKQTLL